MFTCKFAIGWTIRVVSPSVKPLSKAGTCELTLSPNHGSGANRILLKKFEYGVRSNGLSKFTSKKVSTSSQVTVESSRRVSRRFRTPRRQTVQLSIESIEVNCGKSMVRSCVEGSNRSNWRMEAGEAPKLST